MRIEYISHACLSIDTGDTKIVTDPWIYGSAYCGQWNVFPKPVNTRVLDDCQVVLLSHGHEDHFHPPTVEKLPKSARVFYPYAWYGGIKPYLNELGFRDVTEAPTDKTIRVTPDTAVTYVVNNLDSMYRSQRILPCCTPARGGSTKDVFRVHAFRTTIARSTAIRQPHLRFM